MTNPTIEITITGLAGSGKSTLANLIAFCLEQEYGHVIVKFRDEGQSLPVSALRTGYAGFHGKDAIPISLVCREGKISE